ncbi:MAG: hypothetical protein COV97_04810 [Zetaproteobacteria bacterium CG11_big_fil_rev_8_21_14_0_20_59_439]|nr:MAG: hypothetical protein COV97_04810 [Zetaproteobacteria bacterium CG11_big_fil_rev_8_21_14_0_20_59_439]
MDNRKWSSGASTIPPSPPAIPSIGYPTRGNPALGIEATKGGEYWFHQVGEELRAAIVENALAPSDDDLTQLSKAISTQSIDVATRYRQAALAGCSAMIEI